MSSNKPIDMSVSVHAGQSIVITVQDTNIEITGLPETTKQKNPTLPPPELLDPPKPDNPNRSYKMVFVAEDMAEGLLQNKQVYIVPMLSRKTGTTPKDLAPRSIRFADVAQIDFPAASLEVTGVKKLGAGSEEPDGQG